MDLPDLELIGKRGIPIAELRSSDHHRSQHCTTQTTRAVHDDEYTVSFIIKQLVGGAFQAKVDQ